MHARYADERRSRWEDPDEPERSSSYEDAYSNNHRNFGNGGPPVGPIRAGSALRGRLNHYYPKPSAPQLQQRTTPPSTPPRTVASLAAINSSLSSSSSMSARAAARRSRLLESNLAPSDSSTTTSSTSATGNNKYKDREMRLHQSIIYNRARLKQQQKYQRQQQSDHEENMINHTATTIITLRASPDRISRPLLRHPGVSSSSTTTGGGGSGSGALYTSRSRSPASSASSSRAGGGRLPSLSDRSQQSSNRNMEAVVPNNNSSNSHSSNNSITRNSPSHMLPQEPESSIRQRQPEQAQAQEQEHERKQNQPEQQEENNRPREHVHLIPTPQHAEQPIRSQHEQTQQPQPQPQSDDHENWRQEQERQQQQRQLEEERQKRQEQERKQQELEQHRLLEQHRRLQEQRRQQAEEDRLLREQHRLLQEQEEQERLADEREQHFREQRQQQFLEDAQSDDDEFQILPHLADEIGESSVVSGYSKPFDEQIGGGSGGDGGEGGSVLSGYSKPFDEKQDTTTGRSNHYQYVPMAMGDLLHTTTTLTSSPGASRTSSPTNRSETESTLNSSFWKYDAPQAELVNAAISSYRFKLPPPRVSEPAEDNDQEGKKHTLNHTVPPPSSPTAYVKHRQSREHEYYFSSPPQSSQDEDDYHYGADDVDEGAREREEEDVEEDDPSVVDASLIVNEPATPQLSPERSSVSDGNYPSRSPRNDPVVEKFEEEKKYDIVIPSYQSNTKSKRAPDFILNQGDDDEDDRSRGEEAATDDDSLFGYLTEQSKPREEDIDGSSNNKTLFNHNFLDTTDDDEEDGDDGEDSTSTSVETPSEYEAVDPKASASPGSLPLRAQQAWKRHTELQKNNGRKATLEEENKNKVSFGKIDTVHTYHKAKDEAHDNNTLNDSTDSGYTKSLESEVEDIFKDIFLIGSGRKNNPGRRKEKGVTMPPPDDDTLESTDEGSSAMEKKMPAKSKKKTDGEDPLFVGVWNMMESSVGALGGVLGLLNPDDDETTIQTEETGPTMESLEAMPPRSSSYQPAPKPKDDGRFHDPPRRSPTSDSSSKRSPPTSDLSKRSPPPYDSPKRSSQPYANSGKGKAPSPPGKASPSSGSLFEYVSGSILRSKDRSSPNSDSLSNDSELKIPALEAQESSAYSEPYSARSERSSSSDQDSRLAQLATEAARMFHKMHGYEFDDTKDVDVLNDIKFVVVELRLPMGVVFQENQTGCWITKIMPDGIASKTSVAVGDQLAAIDGVSATNMKVDQIADIVRRKKGRFELTLIRYVGKLRPAVQGSDAGFEIKAKKTTTVTKKRPSPVALPMAASPDRANDIRVKDPPDNNQNASATGRTSQRATTPVRSERQEQANNSKRSDSPKRRFGFFGRRKKPES
ncbi:hypothetical protein ACA910_001074 [Epithemia clementina (nom. ined.)]